MRIIIDCYQYQPYVTGTDRQARHFIEELQQIDSTNTYHLICSDQAYVPEAVHATNFIVHRPPALPGPTLLRRLVVKLWKEWFYVRLSIRKADVFFSVHNMQLPRLRVAKKMIMSNLDLIPIVLPAYFSIGRFSKEENERIYRSNAQKADKIMSISEYSKRELSNLLNVQEEKIHVIPLAADLPQQNEKPKALDGIHLPPQFFLTIGGAEVRKNVDKVMMAHSRLPASVKEAFPLVIVGGDWQDKKVPKQSHCIQVGRVPDDGLSYLYGHCSLFIFASSYEGFGLPLLEAFVAGAPSLGAQGTSLDELCEGKIPQFDPENIAELSELLHVYASDNNRRVELGKTCRSLSQKYSWRNSAEKLHALFTSSD